MKLAKTTLSIPITNAGRLDNILSRADVTVYLTNVPGVCVHRDLGVTRNKFTGFKRNSWAITHYPTGALMCGGFFTRKRAVEAAQVFMEGDWVGLTLPIILANNTPGYLRNIKIQIERMSKR